MASQPSGTVTLVFTDIEGSTRLLHELGQDSYRDALGEHRRIVREAFARHSGYEVDYEGDAFFYAFASATDAVAAVAEAQAGLQGGLIRIRVGVHTGQPGLDPPKYVGVDVHEAARIMSAGHGGQVLLSRATRELVDVAVIDLGEHRLKDIHAPVPLYQLGDTRFPPLKTISNTNLPRPASSFVGRETEVGDVVTLVRDHRLVTLTGPGGTGKTRLAIEAAAELVGEFKAGVFWVGLATIRDPVIVLEEIAGTLGAPDLAAWIGERELLLVLDNFEQVVDCAPELSAVLSRCPNLRMLVTSRELLRIDGEVEYEVPVLPEAEAVELFCTRAQALADDKVRELCRRLDYLPLAVELAAARAHALPTAEIVARLSQRLDLLKGRRDADARQQTLRSTIEWSHDLLSPDEQRQFALLAVFAGGCTVETAEAVCEVGLDGIQSLVEKSLLRRTGARYWMLETILEYASERLGETADADLTRERHADHFVALGEAAWRGLRGSAEDRWTAELDAEHDNLRATLRYLLDKGDADRALGLCYALGEYWDMRGHLAEGLRWVEEGLAEASVSGHARGYGLAALGMHQDRLGDWNVALVAFEEATELLLDSDEAAAAQALASKAMVHLYVGDKEGATAVAERAVELARQAGDRWTLAWTLNVLGAVLFGVTRDPSAVDLLEESVRICAELGNVRNRVPALHNLACQTLYAGEVERAWELSSAARRFAADRGDSVFECVAASIAAASALATGRIEEARQALRDSAVLAVELQLAGIPKEILLIHALIAAHEQMPELAVTLWGAADPRSEEIGPELEPLCAQLLEPLRTELDPLPFEIAWAKGAEMPFEDALALAEAVPA